MPIGTIKVPHCGPESRVLLVGETPDANAEHDKLPFVGESGNLLMVCLGRSGVQREEIRLANICNYRPMPDNKFDHVLNSEQLKDSLAELYEYIERVKPTVIGALGRYALEYLTGLKGITRFRGSILPYINDKKIKVVPTYNPTAVLRDRSTYPIFDIDLKRIIEESKHDRFDYPKYSHRSFVLVPSWR